MLDQIISERDLPRAIRCDNGPELTSRNFLAWAPDHKIDLFHIQPGQPTQNAYVESFNSKLREEWLRISWFQNLFETRRIIANWRRDYGQRRPHSSLNYMTPAEFAARARGGKDAAFASLEERPWRFPLSHREGCGELRSIIRMRKMGAGQLTNHIVGNDDHARLGRHWLD